MGNMPQNVSPRHSSDKPKLLDRVRELLRTRHYSLRTEEATSDGIERGEGVFIEKKEPILTVVATDAEVCDDNFESCRDKGKRWIDKCLSRPDDIESYRGRNERYRAGWKRQEAEAKGIAAILRRSGIEQGVTFKKRKSCLARASVGGRRSEASKTSAFPSWSSGTRDRCSGGHRRRYRLRLGGGDDAGFEGVLHEGVGVFPKLEERGVIDVHHVAGFVEGHSHVVTDGRVDLHRMERSIGGVVRRGEIVVAAANPELQIRIATHRLLQIFGDIEILVLGDVRVVPRAHVGNHLVGQIALEL